MVKHPTIFQILMKIGFIVASTFGIVHGKVILEGLTLVVVSSVSLILFISN